MNIDILIYTSGAVLMMFIYTRFFAMGSQN